MYNYIICTDDISAANEKIEDIRKKLSSEYDNIGYDLDDDSIYSLIDELTTISLFETPKFVIVKESEKLADIKEKQALELISAINNRDSQNVVVFLFTKEYDSKSSNLLKLKKYATYFDVRIKNIPLDEYAKKSLLEEGYKISDSSISLLVSYVDSLSSLKTAVEILKIYKNDEKVIDSDDINLMIQKPLDENVYNLIDAVLSKNTKEVFSIYKDLRIRNIMPSYLISLLINKFQEMYNVSILNKANMSQAEIASIFNVSSGRAYYMVKNAKSYNLNKILDNLDYLNRLDANIKTGKVDQYLGLELFFLR